jgi:putative SOS response-associated peptidase YedK
MYYHLDPTPQLRQILDKAYRSPLANRMLVVLGQPLKKDGDMKASDIAPVIATSNKNKLTYFPMIWGYSMPEDPKTRRSEPLLQARIETVASSTAWRENYERRRCVVPASYFFIGSSAGRDTYLVQPAGAHTTLLAGIYRMENDFPRFILLTRPASPEIKDICNRMPVILPKDAVKEWIDPEVKEARVKEIASDAITDVVVEKV